MFGGDIIMYLYTKIFFHTLKYDIDTVSALTNESKAIKNRNVYSICYYLKRFDADLPESRQTTPASSQLADPGVHVLLHSSIDFS